MDSKNPRDQTESRNEPTAQSPIEIPPKQDREHLTEPTWIENMIHMAGVFLGQETPPGDDDSSEEKPRKSAAA